MGRKQENNIGLYIHNLMSSMGVAPMPRNYELFYEYIVGGNEHLKKDVQDLGRTPSQSMVDKLVTRYLPSYAGETVVDSIHHHITRQVDKLIAIMEKEKTTSEGFSSAIKRIGELIEEKPGMTPLMVKSVTDLVAKIAATRLDTAKVTTHGVTGSADDLKRIRTELDDYKRLANTDPLTELANRRAFDEVLSTVYEAKNPSGHALFVIDIDKFKAFNDRFGHPAGDRVLKMVGSAISRNVRNAFVSRIGGEEFAVIVSEIAPEEAVEIGDRIRRAVEGTSLSGPDSKVDFGKATVSVGLCMGSDASNGEDLYRRADAALYASKAAGRNRVTLAQKSAPEVSNIPAPKPRQERYLIYKEAEEAASRREREGEGPFGAYGRS